MMELRFHDRATDDTEIYGKFLLELSYGHLIRKDCPSQRVLRRPNGDWCNIGVVGDIDKIKDKNIIKQLETQRIKALEHHKKHII